MVTFLIGKSQLRQHSYKLSNRTIVIGAHPNWFPEGMNLAIESIIESGLLTSKSHLASHSDSILLQPGIKIISYQK